MTFLIKAWLALGAIYSQAASFGREMDSDFSSVTTESHLRASSHAKGLGSNPFIGKNKTANNNNKMNNNKMFPMTATYLAVKNLQSFLTPWSYKPNSSTATPMSKEIMPSISTLTSR